MEAASTKTSILQMQVKLLTVCFQNTTIKSIWEVAINYRMLRTYRETPAEADDL